MLTLIQHLILNLGRMKNFYLLLLLAAASLFPALTTRAADDPFAWPPITSQTKPWAFNWWMGSAVDKTNLTHELESYAAAGLGGIHIIPIYGAKGFEDKYIPYLSPKWMEMMGWTVSEANRLGMGVDMTTGSGWCFGGPQITDEDANASVVVKIFDLGIGEALKQKFDPKVTQALFAFGPYGKSIDLTGSIKADGEVSFVPPGSWLSNGNSAPPKTWTVYAISQKPSGQKVKRAGPGGEGWMLNLIYPPAMDDFLKPYTAAFAAYTGPKPRAQYHDSYEYRSDWSPNFFAEFEKRRGYKLQTELPALFGDGVLSPQQRAAGILPEEQTSDSSAGKMPAARLEHRARVLCDYRQTVSEIMAEESLPKWVNWSHEHGFLTRNQAHGSPGNWLDLYATVDIPETEMFHADRNKLISKFASSAAHVTGKPLVSSETGTWLEEHFTEKLSDVKYLMDDLFLSGVNHLFYHGCCYSPDEAGWPGWHFYASLEMNPRNSIWRDAPALNAYAARVQSILQSGQPDNDILLYWNTADFWMQPGDKLLPQLTVHARDWFEGQPIGKVAKELWEKGYAFDYVSDAQLKTAKVVKDIDPNRFYSSWSFQNGRSYTYYPIQTPGAKYHTILVPECKYIPLETFQQLLSLAENGAMVIFQKQLPTAIPGLADFKARTDRLHQLQEKIHFDVDTEDVEGMISNASYGKGQIVIENINESASWGSRVGIDFRPDLIAKGLSFVRRSLENGWVYFIVNRSDHRVEQCEIAMGGRGAPFLLNPMSGTAGYAGVVYSCAGQNCAVKLPPLGSGESIFLRVFNEDYFKTNHFNKSAIKPFDYQNRDYRKSGGAPLKISGVWKVKFISGGPTLPAPFQTAKLASWTTRSDTNMQAFAGTAKYEITFDAPPERGSVTRSNSATSDALRLTEPRSSYSLDLGDVRQSARVRVNGKDYGTLLTPPFRVVVDNLKPTGNTLEVEVTSVAANRIRDLDRRGVPWKTFRDINIVDLNYKPFDASNWPLTDCGLLGPVTLCPVTASP